MGRSRWRNRSAGPPHAKGKANATKPTTAPVEVEITAHCPGMSRPGIDGAVTVALFDLDALLREMREGIDYPNQSLDGESAVKRYLVYLSMLVDVTLTDIVMSAVHDNDYAVLMKARMLVEYASKAGYSDAHPEYALWFTTIYEAESVLKKLRNGGAPPEVVAEAEAELARRKEKFSGVLSTTRVPLSEMMREQTRGGDRSRNDEYVWLFGGPSALMHGDPEGMRQLMPVDEEGHQHPTLKLDDDYLNALLVDAGSNALFFCDIFISRFHPSDERLQVRLRALDRRFKELSLKHSRGRDEEVLNTIRRELGEAHGGSP